MIGLKLLSFTASLSLVLALERSESDSSEEYKVEEPAWGKPVLAFPNDVGAAYPHWVRPDYSPERDDLKKRQEYLKVLVQLEEPQFSRDVSVFVEDDNDSEYLNLRQSLTLWAKVERRIRHMLLSSQQNHRLTLKDRSTHSVAVMNSVLGLASNLLESCSSSQYVKTYKKTVSSSLLETFAMPNEVSSKILDVLGSLRRKVSNVRNLVLRNRLPCRSSDYFNRCPSSHQLKREIQLIQALGSLARTVLDSRSLHIAVKNYDEVSFLLNGQTDTTLYTLSVKTARVLKLLLNSSEYNCELPLESQPLAEENWTHINVLKHG